MGDGVRAGKTRRGTRARQVAPGAAAVLLRAAADGGALSRAYLVDLASGAPWRGRCATMATDRRAP